MTSQKCDDTYKENATVSVQWEVIRRKGLELISEQHFLPADLHVKILYWYTQRPHGFMFSILQHLAI